MITSIPYYQFCHECPVQVAKEKALQLERKKKAAHFLAQLAEKKTGVSSVRAVEGEADRSSAEEGELVVGEEEGAGPPDNNVSAGQDRDRCEIPSCDAVTLYYLVRTPS